MGQVKRWKNRTPVQHEANKAAQRRYRERKKGQVTELQAQAEQLAAQVPPPAPFSNVAALHAVCVRQIPASTQGCLTRSQNSAGVGCFLLVSWQRPAVSRGWSNSWSLHAAQAMLWRGQGPRGSQFLCMRRALLSSLVVAHAQVQSLQVVEEENARLEASNSALEKQLSASSPHTSVRTPLSTTQKGVCH